MKALNGFPDRHRPEPPPGSAGLTGIAKEVDELVVAVAADAEAVLGEGLGVGDLADIDCEIALRAGRPGLAVEGLHAEGDRGDVRLFRNRLAGEAVEPPFQPAGQAEVVRMHGEDVPLPEDRAVEPGRSPPS